MSVVCVCDDSDTILSKAKQKKSHYFVHPERPSPSLLLLLLLFNSQRKKNRQV